MFSNLKRKTRVHRIVWRFHPRSLNPTEIQITYRFASPKKNPVLSHLSENPGVYRPPFPATPETHGAPLPVSFPSQPRIASLLFKSSATVRRPCVRLSAPTANDRRRRRRQRSLTARRPPWHWHCQRFKRHLQRQRRLCLISIALQVDSRLMKDYKSSNKATCRPIRSRGYASVGAFSFYP